jgi:hypothetical protein
MRAAEILRKLADVVDAAESGGEVDQLGRDSGSEGGDTMDNKTMDRMDPVDNEMPGEREEEAPEPEMDTMVPPLQQELELEKKEAGVDNDFDKNDSEDELISIKRIAGL